METAQITNQQAREAIELAAVRASVWEDELAGPAYPDGYTEAAVDRLLEEMDRELAEAERTEQVRVTHEFTDQIRARRAHRRAGRVVMRALPSRVAVPTEFEREAA